MSPAQVKRAKAFRMTCTIDRAPPRHRAHHGWLGFGLATCGGMMQPAVHTVTKLRTRAEDSCTLSSSPTTSFLPLHIALYLVGEQICELQPLDAVS